LSGLSLSLRCIDLAHDFLNVLQLGGCEIVRIFFRY
jgi:hypothetical protein